MLRNLNEVFALKAKSKIEASIIMDQTQYIDRLDRLELY